MDRAGSNPYPSRGGAPLFREVQRFDQWWLWLLLLAATVLPLVLFSAILFGPGLGTAPPAVARGTWVFGLVLTVGLLALFARAALVVEVWPAGLSVRFRGFFVNRTFAWSAVRSFEAVTYSPLGEYGGWGIRGSASNRAYTVKGERGVRLLFRDGDRLLVGSQRPEQLVRAIARASRPQRDEP